jgi:hypothetical protein
MAIPPKQIGWSEKANLLWQISKQLDRLNSQMCIGGCPTTTTTTTENPCRQFVLTYLVASSININGINCEGIFFNISLKGESIIGETYNLCAFSVVPSEQYSIEDIGICL